MQIYVYIFHNKTLFSIDTTFFQKEWFFYNTVVKRTILRHKKIRAYAKDT
jgi:hypothetical protein